MGFLYLLCFFLGLLTLGLGLIFLLAYESHDLAEPGPTIGLPPGGESPEGVLADGRDHPFWAKPALPLSRSAFWLAFGAGGILGHLFYGWLGSLICALLLGALGAGSIGRVALGIRHLLERRTLAQASRLARAGAIASSPLAPLGIGLAEPNGLTGQPPLPVRSLESTEIAARARLTLQRLFGRLAYVRRRADEPPTFAR